MFLSQMSFTSLLLTFIFLWILNSKLFYAALWWFAATEVSIVLRALIACLLLFKLHFSFGINSFQFIVWLMWKVSTSQKNWTTRIDDEGRKELETICRRFTFICQPICYYHYTQATHIIQFEITISTGYKLLSTLLRIPRCTNDNVIKFCFITTSDCFHNFKYCFGVFKWKLGWIKIISRSKLTKATAWTWKIFRIF